MLITLLAEQYFAEPRARHSRLPRLYDALSTVTAPGSVVTCMVSLAGLPLTSVMVSVKLYVRATLDAGTTNVGLAVVGFFNAAPSWTASVELCAQLNVDANFDAVPSRVTTDVGTTPNWSGPASATGAAFASATTIAALSVLVLPVPAPVTVRLTV